MEKNNERENLIYSSNHILKVIIPRKIFNKYEENIKLIFVGDVNYDTKKILYKLEKNEELNSNEEKTLNKHIPSYKKNLVI